ncbi:MAG: acetate kinase [Pseudomonadota bacterium]
MRGFPLTTLRGAGIWLLLCAPLAQAGTSAPKPRPAKAQRALAAQVSAIKNQLAEQRALIEALRRELAMQRAAAPPHAATVAPAQSASTSRAPATAPSTTAAAAAGLGAPPVSAVLLDAQRGAGAAAPQESPVAETASREARQRAAVGTPPLRTGRPPVVAALFEQPGVLTQRGKIVLEPALQFGYSSSNRVALVGYTVIPALLIGLVDVREVKRNTLTATLSGRYGLSNRLELEARLPYVYRSDSTVSREIFTGTALERVFDTSGKHLGDAELGVRYQLNQGAPDRPYYIGGLRFKSRTGRDPFEVVTDCTRRCVGENASGTGLPLTLPTGSGFYSLQPSLTWLFPSDPAVLFGSVSYLHNFKRGNVSRTVLGGEREPLGEVAPGGIIGFNFGMGLALNDRTSLSLGYEHSSVARTRQNGAPVPGAVRTQLGSFLVGYSYRLNDKRSINVSVGAGLTRDTPDVSLTVRVPVTLD